MKLPVPFFVLAFFSAACTYEPPMKPIEFLTRTGCVQTKLMRVRTETAIKQLGLTNPYTVTDLDTLPESDVRRAYPTPTVLLGGVDLFGMDEPKPPFPEPT